MITECEYQPYPVYCTLCDTKISNPDVKQVSWCDSCYNDLLIKTEGVTVIIEEETK